LGDWVIADDPTTPGEISARQVLDTFVRETTALVDLYVDGEVISTTGEHPFWTPDKGWVEAKDLQVGSLLQTEDGRVIDVDKVEKRSGQFEVYNFNVEGFHTYFVSDLGILVHNTCGGSTPNKPRNGPSEPDPLAKGYPHSIIERPGLEGQYTTHYGDGTWKQYRGSGKDHGGIPRPNVKEVFINKSPDGREFRGKPQVRPPTPDEIPGS
jgi:hypothetical protein